MGTIQLWFDPPKKESTGKGHATEVLKIIYLTYQGVKAHAKML